MTARYPGTRPRAACAVGLVLLACLPAAAGAPSASAVRARCAALIAQIEPRQGIQVRSLLIVPLVAKSAAAHGGARLEISEVVWRSEEGEAEQDTILRPAKPSPEGSEQAPAALPTGLILRRGTFERLLARPSLVPPTGTTTVAATSVPHAGALAEAAALGPVATPALRRSLFLQSDDKALAQLIAFEAAVAGLPPAKGGVSLAEIAAATDVSKLLQAAQPQVAKIADAYGGETLGHIVFVGNRPIDVLLTGTPDRYAEIAALAAPGLALSLALWERWYGLDEQAPAAASWPAVLEASQGILKSLSESTCQRQRAPRGTGHAAGGEHGSLWRIKGRGLRGASRPSELGWLLLDEAGVPVLLEAWPEPQAGPLPSPASEPGGPGKDEEPDGARGGGLSQAYLQRLLERRAPR